jgi:hypothetical protein
MEQATDGVRASPGGHEHVMGAPTAAVTLNVADYLPNFKPAKSELLQRWYGTAVLSAMGGQEKEMKDELLSFVQGVNGQVRNFEGNDDQREDKKGSQEDMEGERSSRAPPWTKVRNTGPGSSFSLASRVDL